MNPINVYAIVTPIVLFLVLAEFVYCLYKKNGYYSFQDSLIGLGTAILAQCVNVLVTVIVIQAYSWIYNNFAIQQVQPSLLTYILCYIGTDFLFYWFHRAGHRINFLWAIHVPHHSGEELNYAVALRAGYFQRAASFLFYWPLAVLGFSPEMIIPVVALNLVIQLLPHTRVIPKLPSWIDSWLNTPYHHQVHHAANPIYWDKNYGGTFIFWDKWFGSYADQTEEPYYGVTIHPESWDPNYLNFHWFVVLWNDAKAATHFVDKIKIWFMPPGWRPRNLGPYDKKPPVNAKAQIKYVSKALAGSTWYLIFQMLASMAVMMLVISDKSVLSAQNKVILSILLWITVIIWGGILESKPWAKISELIRLPIMAGFLTYLGYGQISIILAVGFFAWALIGMKPANEQKTNLA